MRDRASAADGERGRATEATTYKPALDGLRAVAAVIVLLSHAWSGPFPGGGLGVDLFFALSGYLITSLLLAEAESNGRLDLPRFYGRRALRLLPALFLLLIAVALYGQVTDGSDWGALLAVALYVGNWVRAFGGDLGLLGPTWSLAVEEQFYLVWPLLVCLGLWLFRRLGIGLAATLAWCSAIGCLLALVLRVALWDPANTARLYNGADTRMDNLLYGCLLACLLHLVPHDRLRRLVAPTFPIAVAGIVVLVLLEPQGTEGAVAFIYRTAGYAAVAVASAIVVAQLVLSPQSLVARILATSPAVWLGRISYGLYLWQTPALAALHLAGAPVYLLFPAGFALTVAAAYSSYVLLERPLQRRFRAKLVVIPRPTARHSPAYVDAQP